MKNKKEDLARSENMVEKLTLKKAEGYIRSRKVVVTLEFRSSGSYRWWVNFSWIDRDPKFCSTYFLANKYFNKLAKKWGLDIEYFYDKEDKY